MTSFAELIINTPFSNLPEDRQANIREMAVLKRFLKGEFISHRDDVWPYLLLVRSGSIQAIKESEQGRSLVLETFMPGNTFWGLALFYPNKPNPMAIQCASDSEVYLWDKMSLEQIISQDTQIAWGVFQMMAERMESAGKIVEEMVFQALPSRLANLLLDQFDSTKGSYVSRDLTLDQMAARIGTTKEMVCKLLYQFSAQGIINIRRTEMKINDRTKLDEIANMYKR